MTIAKMTVIIERDDTHPIAVEVRGEKEGLLFCDLWNSKAEHLPQFDHYARVPQLTLNPLEALAYLDDYLYQYSKGLV